jgi:hypothetical protein
VNVEKPSMNYHAMLNKIVAVILVVSFQMPRPGGTRMKAEQSRSSLREKKVLFFCLFR